MMEPKLKLGFWLLVHLWLLGSLTSCSRQGRIIALGAEPTDLAMDARGRYLYIVCESARTLLVWDLQQKKESAETKLKPGPYRLYLDRDNQTLRVLCCLGKQILTYQVPELKLKQRIVLPDPPSAWLKIPGTSQTFLCSVEKNLLQPYLQTHALATVEVGRQPVDLLWQPETDRIWVANFKGQEVAVVSREQNAVVKKVVVWPNPSKLLFDPVGQRLFVLCTGQDALPAQSMIQLVDLNYYSAGLKWPVGKDARDFILGPRSQTLLIIDENKLRVLSQVTGQVLQVIPTGQDPRALVASPDGRYVYVACRQEQAVYVYHLSLPRTTP